jgi:hypothetical protein
VYKYGCSDERFHPIGAVPWLFWQAFQEAKSDQLEEFDLGRSDLTNPGLIRFKDRLGATKTPICYWRFPNRFGSTRGELSAALNSPAVRKVLSRLPQRLFRLAGEFFYRHAS